MESDSSDRHYTAGDVGRVTGLTYRQLNDWGGRGAMPDDSERRAAWRRFTPREIFSLLVCAELRKNFGVSVERLRWVQEFMLQEDADHYAAAIGLMATLGVEVWLMTDFEDTFVMDSELEFADMWEHRYFGGPTRFFAFLQVSPLVNRMLATLKEPVQLDSRGRGWEIAHEARNQFSVRTPEELAVLQMVRSGRYESVEIVLKDGTIKRIKTTEHPDAYTRVADLLGKNEYQTITITEHAGRVVAIRQEISVKP